MRRTNSHLSLLPLALLISTVFPINASGQVIIRLSELNSELTKYSVAPQLNIGVVGERLFVATDTWFWVLSKDGRQAVAVEQIQGHINNIKVIGGEIFVGTTFGLWLVSKDGKQANLIFTGSVDYLEEIGGQLLVISDKDLLIGKKDGALVKVGNITGEVDTIEKTADEFLVKTAEGFWVIRKDGKQVAQIKISKELFFRAEAFGDYFYANDERGLWRISKDGETTQVKEVEGKVNSFEKAGDRLFAFADTGVWMIRKDGSAAKVLGPQIIFVNVKAFGNTFFVFTGASTWMINEAGEATRVPHVRAETFVSMAQLSDGWFIGTDAGFWSVSKDGKEAAGVDGIARINYMAAIGERILIDTGAGLWTFGKTGKLISTTSNVRGYSDFTGAQAIGDYIYFIGKAPSSIEVFLLRPEVRIKTKLAPINWWARVVSYISPSNWLPAEKTQVTAEYSDETGNNPYAANIPRRFWFAIADGDALPSDSDFSPQLQFNYDIDWGRNDVRYWVKDKWGNVFLQTATYYGVPSQYFFVALPFILSIAFVLGCFALAPQASFPHSAIMNPWLRKYFSLGSVPLLLSTSPALRRHILRRYFVSVSKDKEFTEWKERFVYPDEAFHPANFGMRLESERRLLLTGQSGIGKTSFFKNLTAYYVSEDKPEHPAKVFPVYISLTNYGGNSLEELVYNQLFSYGKITDKELAPMFLEQGGLLIFLDGVNEVQNVSDRQKLSEFVEKFWTSNYICLSSQQSYPEIENIPRVELKAFTPEKVREFIRQRASDKETAERMIKTLRDEDYKLYSVPRDLEFAVEILNPGAESLPTSRTELYKIIFSSIFARWKESGNADAEDILCERAYTMIVQRDLAFDSADNPKFKEISEDLFKQKFLVKREGSYNFRHDLIRAFLASEFFYPRWENLFEELRGKPIDSNWLEMLKFSCEKISDSGEVKNLVYEVLEKSVRKDLVKSLFRWLKDNHPQKCSSWEADFYARYGESDFK